MTAETVDQILSIAALAVPVLAVVGIRNRILAIFFGTVSAWLIIDASSDWIHKFAPEYEPNSISNTIWIGLGWIPALIYSSLLWFAKTQIQKLGKNKKKNEPNQ